MAPVTAKYATSYRFPLYTSALLDPKGTQLITPAIVDDNTDVPTEDCGELVGKV